MNNGLVFSRTVGVQHVFLTSHCAYNSSTTTAAACVVCARVSQAVRQSGLFPPRLEKSSFRRLSQIISVLTWSACVWCRCRIWTVRRSGPAGSGPRRGSPGSDSTPYSCTTHQTPPFADRYIYRVIHCRYSGTAEK